MQFGTLFRGDTLPEPVCKAIIPLVVRVARNPNPAGEFAAATAHLRTIADDAEFVEALVGIGYDCIVALEGSAFAGLIAYQDKGKDGWHMFSIDVVPSMEGRGVGTALLTRFLLTWSRTCTYNRVRLWQGDKAGTLSDKNKAAMQALYGKVIADRLDLPFVLRPVPVLGYGYLERRTRVARNVA